MRLARTKKAMKTLLLPGARKNASLADLTVSNEMPSDGRRAGDGSDDDDGRDESWVPDEEEEEDVEYEESEGELLQILLFTKLVVGKCFLFVGHHF